jgi:hypothetical protein
MICALLFGAAWGRPLSARGGHGMGGFGMHGLASGPEGFLMPAYVLITVSMLRYAKHSSLAEKARLHRSAFLYEFFQRPLSSPGSHGELFSR